jgi:hypothetical protein
MVWRDDVRRVVANWSEYGGLVMDKSGKDRPAYEKSKSMRFLSALIGSLPHSIA